MERFSSFLSTILIKTIKLYQFFLSPLLGNRCRFFPSCSEYFQEAVKELGLLKGMLVGMKRLLKCHPFHPGGCDPAPKKVIK